MEILENKIELLDDFIRLNEEWISTYFKIEAIDQQLAADPIQIINKGGYIFSLIEHNDVAGVCALFNEGDGTFELARMAVSPQHQGKGFGNALIQACLKKLVKIGANKVYLLSNTKLESAIALYNKHGFKTVSQGPHPVYSRANIVMMRNL